jgi:hypothetical protein
VPKGSGGTAVTVSGASGTTGPVYDGTPDNDRVEPSYALEEIALLLSGGGDYRSYQEYTFVSGDAAQQCVGESSKLCLVLLMCFNFILKFLEFF